LTEKDYFEFVINTNKEEAQDIPSILRKEIATSSLLFIGYSVDDIDFRTIFQGFLTFLDSMLAKGKREPSVAVQLPPEISKKGKAKMQRYLEQYTRNLYPNVHQFWGDTSDFITELDKRWRDFKQGK
jgi:SIR2-like domain